MSMRWLLFTFLSIPAVQSYTLPHFSVQDLRSPTPDTLAALHHAIGRVGMFAVSDSTIRPAPALQELLRCVHSGGAAGHTNEVVLQDMTLRTTIATSTNQSAAQAFGEGLGAQCPHFVAAAATLRTAAAEVGHAYAHALDRLGAALNSQQEGSLVDDPPGDRYREVVADAESLEHFHVFRRLAGHGAPTGVPALRLHSDMGLFIVMTPPRYYRLDSAAPSPGAAGFHLQLPSGAVVTPELPPDALLVMNGEGNAHWVRSPTASRLFAPPHEVVLPDMSGLGRTWYGRMYLPPRAAMHRRENTTFNQYWAAGRAALVEGAEGDAAPAVGCSPGRRRLLDEGACGAGEVYCWLTCMAVGHLSCNASDILCQDPEGNQWPEAFLDSAGQPSHCFACDVTCPAVDSTANTTHDHTSHSNEGFCSSTQPVVMWMSGFQTVRDKSDPCVALFIREWALDTAGAFAGACIGVFLMALTMEVLVWLRRTVALRHARQPAAKWPHRAVRGVLLLLLYGAQITLGYFLMLVAMTYQVELFIMLVAGLVVGHAALNLRAPVAETADPCCQGHAEAQAPKAEPTSESISTADPPAAPLVYH